VPEAKVLDAHRSSGKLSSQAKNEWLECVACAATYEVAPMFFGCPRCAEVGHRKPLEMCYGERLLTRPGSPYSGIWGWASHLPSVAQQDLTTLYEGATSLLPLAISADGPKVYLKNESTNPTWSWKDRPNAISITMARHFGYRSVVSISTGNHGNAMAAMAAAAGLRATVFCNSEAPALQLAMMERYGARVVRGGNAEAMLLDLVRRGDHFPCTVLSPRAGYSNPFGIEGFKTIAFEIWQQLGKVPDRVFVGVGSGDGVYGIWKGFRELRKSGLVDTVPRIIGCQASGANSLVRAFRAGHATITPLTSMKTVAASLMELAVGEQALSAVYDSGGGALEVSDKDTLESMRWLCRQGIALEPSSAVPLACLRYVIATEDITNLQDEIWVTIGSGAATKWPEDVLRNFTIPELLEPSQSVLI
jgi:threonine synthase